MIGWRGRCLGSAGKGRDDDDDACCADEAGHCVINDSQANHGIISKEIAKISHINIIYP